MAPKSTKSPKLSQNEAEQLAIEALGFIASDSARLTPFFSVTGFDPATIRAEAGSPDFLAGVLEFLLSDESMLLVFSSHKGIDPSIIEAGRRVLAADFGSMG